MTATSGAGPAGPPAAVGVDVGGTKLLAVLVDGSGAVVGERRRPVPPPGAVGRAGAVHPLVEAVASEVRPLLDQARSGRLAVPAVGVGLAGLVTADGRLRGSAHLPHAEGVDLRGQLGDALGLPVTVDNDATCATLAEWRLGAARGCSDAVVVTVGTGIGTGLVVAGRLVRGGHGLAGEGGHMVVDPDGPPCPCGRRGCWERYASGDGLGAMARRAARTGGVAAVVARAGGRPSAVRGEHVTAAAADGDADARALVAELARWLALGIANLLAVLDSRRVVIGGGLAEAGADLIGPLQAALRRPEVLGRGRPPVEVVAAHLGGRAGAVGAALLARGGR